tara:strand:- start:1029 stop:2087 length:1059 start_codon:yes stop_codon:yes gene_type:complete
MPFKSKDQFFYMMYNEPAVFADWIETYGVPKKLKVGSTEHWRMKINQIDPKRNLTRIKKQMRRAEEFAAYNPPQAAVNNAKRGLKLREKWGRGGLSPAEARAQGIDSGVTRAKKISTGKVSRHDVRRMSAFNRHRKNYRPSVKKPDGGPTAGTIAWLLWGGTSGVNWAKKVSATMNAEDIDIQGNSIKAKVNALRGGVEVFTMDKDKLQDGDLMKYFLNGVIFAFQTVIKGVDVAGIEKTLEEVSVKFLPIAENRAEMMAMEGYEENEHYHMGEIWGYDEAIDYLSPYTSSFQRQFVAETIDIDIDLDDTLTRKEVKMVMWYPLIIGFLGGTLANVVSNYVTLHWLTKKGKI